MTEVIGVRFRGGCKEYYFDPHGITVEPNQFVIVETAQGLEYAQCVSGNHEVEDDSVVQPLRPLVRVATENDDRTYAYNKTREKNAFEVCQKKIAERGLDMKLVRVESNFDGSKIIFFFTSDGRVDFRELVRDLAGVFRARIELRQIGVRDEAKMLGGLGICGRPFCCSQFLDDFVPVSIKMAKTQNLSLNPTKISGTCGRLMCCLKYEQNAYEDAVRRCPKQDSFVATPDGLGNVSSVDILREQVLVRLDGQNESPKRYRTCEIHVLRNGKGSRDAQALLLSTRKTQARLLELVLDLVPQGSATKGVLDQLIEHDAVAHPHAARTVGDVVVDAHGKRIGALEHHTHALAQAADIVIAQDILAVECNLAFNAAILDTVVHTVKAAQQRRLSAARRPDERGDLLVADLDIHVLERMMVAIEQVEALDVDARRRGGKILCRGASRIPNLALVRGLGLRFHEFFKLRGLHSRSSRHTAYLHIDINSAVSIVEIAAHMHVSALSSVCKGTLAMRRAARW